MSTFDHTIRLWKHSPGCMSQSKMRDRSWSESGSRQSSSLSHDTTTWKDSGAFDSDSSSEFDTYDVEGSESQGGALGPPRTFQSPEHTGNELAILIMGVTGSGKSTFISRLTDDNVEIGHSLESCKQACDIESLQAKPD
jgi:hypothetical protein